MVGSAIVKHLRNRNYNSLILKSRKELDLTNQNDVQSFYKKYKPEFVFICAAKVGGVQANNTYRAQFIYENLQIQNNLIHFAHVNGVKKLLFMGSSCIYPRDCPQPIKEEYLLSGYLEKTNEPYAIAKIAGIKMCENYYHQYGSHFFSIMPTNAYGPNDNYNLETSHVLPALIRKFHEAKINNNNYVTLWGSGTPLREFIYVDDIADASIFIMNIDFNKLYKSFVNHINVGSGIEISIMNLAKIIANKIDYKGDIRLDTTKPDGTPRKIMDSSRLQDLGWIARVSLEKGIDLAYNSFIRERKNAL